MKRIIIVGTTGRGKTTLAKKLSKKLNYPHIEIDALYWKPNWQGSSMEELRAELESKINCEEWIIDGNYGRTQFLTWPLADTVIWIDLPLWKNFKQNFLRGVRRSLDQKELWPNTNNKENFIKMFSRDSILMWLLKTYPTNKKRYEKMFLDPENKHIKFHRFSSIRAVNQFVDSI